MVVQTSACTSTKLQLASLKQLLQLVSRHKRVKPLPSSISIFGRNAKIFRLAHQRTCHHISKGFVQIDATVEDVTIYPRFCRLFSARFCRLAVRASSSFVGSACGAFFVGPSLPPLMVEYSVQPPPTGTVIKSQ